MTTDLSIPATLSMFALLLIPIGIFIWLQIGLVRETIISAIRMAVQLGRGVNRDLKCGICGEHGGDPRSVEFCHEVGLNYVSCSPFRVPTARLAAAQAAIKNGSKK